MRTIDIYIYIHLFMYRHMFCCTLYVLIWLIMWDEVLLTSLIDNDRRSLSGGLENNDGVRHIQSIYNKYCLPLIYPP